MERLVVKPRLTEKTYFLAQQGIYTFEAPIDANCQAIAHAIELAHNVKVTSIKVAVQTGKAKRFNKGKRAYPGIRYESNTKKVYVRLGEGQTIPVFNQGTDTENKESK